MAYTVFVAPLNNGTIGSTAADLAQALKAPHFKAIGGTSNTIAIDAAAKLLADNAVDQLMEDIIVAYYQAAGNAPIVVIEGLDADSGVLTPFAAQLNAQLARNVHADVVFVGTEDAACTAKLSASLLGLSSKQVLATVTSAEQIDTARILANAKIEREAQFSPPVFRQQLIESARKANKRIVLPEGEEPRTVKAAIICTEKKIARCVLMAKREDVERVAAEQGLTVPAELEIMDPAESRANYVAPLVEMRKSKGMTPEKALEELQDTVMQGTVMMALDEVDGLVSGAVHTTANTVRPALQIIKTAPGSNIVSSVFFMLMPDQVLVYGDCAINPNPTAEQLADIAIQSADSAKGFGIEPRVAMISYSTGTSGAGPEVEKVAAATQLALAQRPDLAIDGPLQYDAATVESVGRSKAPNSKVAGRATVLVFPDLNTGNCTYKAVQRSANVIAVGPMLQGLRKPVNDLSRGALVDDIVFTIALTAIQATQMGQ